MNKATNECTMNSFGWDLKTDSQGGDLVDTPIHEIVYLFGFLYGHHQNPFAGSIWDEEAVYRTFAHEPNNWDRNTTFHNLLKEIPTKKVTGSRWDSDSKTDYSFGPGLLESPAECIIGLDPKDGSAKTDIAMAKSFYPPIVHEEDNQCPSLVLNRVVALKSPEGSYQNYFVIQPEQNGRYRMRAFGAIDSLLVLSEYNTDGSVRFIEADDDIGFLTDASIDADLKRGRKYLLQQIQVVVTVRV